MNLGKPAFKTGIFGASGSGKSTQMKELLDKLLPESHYRGAIIVDVQGDWPDDVRKLGGRSYKTLKGLYSAMYKDWNKGFVSVLDLSDFTDTEARAMFLTLCDDLRKIQQPYKDGKDNKRVILVCDEMADLEPNRTLKADEEQFKFLCRRGRHFGVDIIGGSQRFSDVATHFRGNLTECYYFNLPEKRDIDYVRSKIGGHADQITELEVHEYLHVKSGKITKGWNEFAKKQRKSLT